MNRIFNWKEDERFHSLENKENKGIAKGIIFSFPRARSSKGLDSVGREA